MVTVWSTAMKWTLSSQDRESMMNIAHKLSKSFLKSWTMMPMGASTSTNFLNNMSWLRTSSLNVNKRLNRVFWQIILVLSRLGKSSLRPSRLMVISFRAQWESCIFLWSAQRTLTEWITLMSSATKETSTVRQDQQRDSAQLTVTQNSALRWMTIRHPLSCRSLTSTVAWPCSRLKLPSKTSSLRPFPRMKTFGSSHVRMTIHLLN